MARPVIKDGRAADGERPPTSTHPSSKRKSKKKERRIKKDGEPFKRRDRRAWLRQMKQLQKRTNLIFPIATIDRVINDILRTMATPDGHVMSMQPRARRALHCAAEQKCHEILGDANHIATQCAHLQGPSKACFDAAVALAHRDVLKLG